MSDASEIIYDALLALASDPIILVREDGRVLRANVQAQQLMTPLDSQVRGTSLPREGGFPCQGDIPNQLDAAAPQRTLELSRWLVFDVHLRQLFSEAAGVADWVPGRVKGVSAGEFLRVHVRTCRLPGLPPVYAIKLQNQTTAPSTFQTLNEQITALNRTRAQEVQARIELEAQNRVLQDRTNQLSHEILSRQRVESRLSTVLNAVGQGVLEVDADGAILMVNREVTALFGYDEAELLGQPIDLLIPESQRPQHHRLRQQYMEDPVTRAMGHGRELWGRHKNGQLVPVEIGLNTIRQGQQTHIVVTVLDITERRRQQTELIQKARSLESSNRELRDFAYIATHDLKEPLRGISNYSTFLLEDYDDLLDTDGREMLHSLVRLAERMERFISSLFDYSRVGQMELDLKPVDLHVVVQEVLATLLPQLRELNVRCIVKSRLPTLVCDRLLLQQVFLSLIENAVKYNDKPDRRVDIDCHQQGDQVRFVVRDNGVGIPAHLSRKVFKIFRRLHTPEEFGGGTGAGLTLVQKIVERHGGQIWLESTVGEGTTFYFTLG